MVTQLQAVEGLLWIWHLKAVILRWSVSWQRSGANRQAKSQGLVERHHVRAKKFQQPAHLGGFSRQTCQQGIPKDDPFLKRLWRWFL